VRAIFGGVNHNEIRAAPLKLKPGGPIQAPGPVFNFALISIRD
jgi:hypothetical protein